MSNDTLANAALLAGTAFFIVAGSHMAWVQVRTFRLRSEISQHMEDLRFAAMEANCLNDAAYLEIIGKLDVVRQLIPDLSIPFILALGDFAEKAKAVESSPAIPACENEVLNTMITLNHEWLKLRVPKYLLRETLTGWIVVRSTWLLGLSRMFWDREIRQDIEPLILSVPPHMASRLCGEHVRF